jgi:hypothetical protein
MLTVITCHIALAIILFFVINFLGQHSPSSLGYYQLTSFFETDEAPAFNYLIRVLTPTVFTILISTLFYSLKLDNLIVNIYLVSVYYVVFRLLFNLAINRSHLINWPKQFLYLVSIIVINYFVYDKFIKIKSNLLPDFSNMANELWIIIIIFLYNFINNISLSDKNAQKRKDKYIATQFARINAKYNGIVSQTLPHVRLRQIALALIIFEDFNRPRLFRFIENFVQIFSNKPHTLGIMQVKSAKRITDKQSVSIGTRKLLADFDDLKILHLSDNDTYGTDEYKDESYQRKLIEKYNPDLVYSYEIIELANDLNRKYYSNSPTKLF